MLQRLSVFVLVFPVSPLFAQVRHAPPPELVCPPSSWREVPDGGSPPFAVGEFMLGFSSEWLVWQENIDTTTFEYSLVHAHHLPTGVRTSTGVKSELFSGVSVYSTEGSFVFQSVSEQLQGSVLNGDGDFHDDVLHLFDLNSLTLHNLGLSIGLTLRGGGPTPTCLFLVEETSDENGDGDTDDEIVYGGDLRTGAIVSTGTAASLSDLCIEGTRAAWLVGEEPGLDLNGDGDFADDVHFVYDFAAGVGVPLGLATGLSSRLGKLSEGIYAFSVDESDQGADLNNDGDQADNVVHAFSFDDLVLRNSGVARHPFSGPLIDSGKVAFIADPSLHAIVLDVASGAVSDLGLPVVRPPVIDEERLIFLANEGGIDRNGDGDTLDRIPWIHHLVLGTTTFVPRAAAPLDEYSDADEDRLLFLQDEAGQAATDLNGDGDAADRVWSLYALSSGAVRNLRLAHSTCGSGALFGGYAALAVEDPTLGHVWVNASTDGPQRTIVGSGGFDCSSALFGKPLVVEGLGLAGLQFYSTPPGPAPPAARFLVFGSCP